MFMADLVRYLNLSVEMEFITLSSYGADIETSGRVKIVRGLGTPVKGRDVVVVEDIVDTGETLSFLLKYLIRSKPASVKVCTLLDKVARRRVAVPIDYRGFVVPDAFVVGYGLDCGEQFRHLPGIYVLKGEDAG
jgi:hypoxanthine phosphoribosyltransferase